MEKTLYVDESLAKGLTHRLFGEIEHQEDVILKIDPDNHNFKRMKDFDKYVACARISYGRLNLLDYVGGSTKKPYFASHVIQVYKELKHKDERGEWDEDGLYGCGLIFNTNPYFKSTQPVGYRIRKHLITRLFQRNKPEYKENGLIDCLGVLRNFKFVPFWWAFWDELLFTEGAGRDEWWGEFNGNFRPVIPSEHGLFLCRFVDKFLDINTFVESSMLRPEQLSLLKELKKISNDLLSSPLPFELQYFAIRNQYGVRLDSSRLVMELICKRLINSKEFSNFKNETLQPDDARDNAGLINAEKLKYKMEELLHEKVLITKNSDAFETLIRERGLRKTQTIFNHEIYRARKE